MIYTVENCPKSKAASNRCVNGKYKCGGCGGIWKTCPVCRGRKATQTNGPTNKAVAAPEVTKAVIAGQTVKVRVNGVIVDKVIGSPRVVG